MRPQMLAICVHKGYRLNKLSQCSSERPIQVVLSHLSISRINEVGIHKVIANPTWALFCKNVYSLQTYHLPLSITSFDIEFHWGQKYIVKLSGRNDSWKANQYLTNVIYEFMAFGKKKLLTDRFFKIALRMSAEFCTYLNVLPRTRKERMYMVWKSRVSSYWPHFN